MASSSLEQSSPPTKKGFVRTRIPTRERILTGVIFLLLVGIGIAIYWKGQHYDPNRFSLREGALSSTTEEVEGKAATIRESTAEKTVVPEEADSVEEEYAMESEPAESEPAETREEPAAGGEPLVVAVEGLEPLGDTEFYNEETLFEKINGRAPAYIEFAFQNLRARSFGVADTAGSYVDVLEFEMASPVGAFGIFSAEREEGGKPLEFADDGYASEMGYFFRRGPCYVQIIASDQNEDTMRLAEAVARDRATALPGGDEGLAARKRLPKEGLRPDTVEYIQANAFGQAALHDVFQARYDTEHGEVEFFVMLGKPSEIDAAWKSYQEFGEKFGEIHETFEEGNDRGFVGESFGNWIAIYARDNEIGGVVESTSSEAARAFVRNYLARPGVDRAPD